MRVWTKSENYWDTYYYMLENVVRQFGKDGIEAPKLVAVIKNE